MVEASRAAAAFDTPVTKVDRPDGVPAVLGADARIGRYLVQSVIGYGGMGLVYAALDPELKRRVALKVLRRDSYAEESIDVAQGRLLREARAMASLSHPNVVMVHDVGTFGNEVFLAMELVEGRTLRAWCAEATRDWREILAVVCAAGRGLAAAHATGLIHRDFKPENVLVGVDGRVRVTDFGMARQREAQEPSVMRPLPPADDLGISRLTRTGSLVGTPAYMAPEQLIGDAADARSDQYAFCITLHEALFGERPMDANTVEELRSRRCTEELPDHPMTKVVPRAVHLAIRRGLAQEADARHGSMNELLEVLERTPPAVAVLESSPAAPIVATRRGSLVGAVALGAILATASLAMALVIRDEDVASHAPAAAPAEVADRSPRSDLSSVAPSSIGVPAAAAGAVEPVVSARSGSPATAAVERPSRTRPASSRRRATRTRRSPRRPERAVVAPAPSSAEQNGTLLAPWSASSDPR